MTHRVLITAAATFALALGAFGLLARGGGSNAAHPPGGPGSARAQLPSSPPPSATTDQRIAALQRTVRMEPQAADGYTLLAGAYAQKVRETGDASFYNRAAGALRQALELDPRDPAAITQRGALELSRHDFRGGLRDALAARRLAPQVDKPFGVLVDALVELGRYGQAERALQEMVDRKPDLAAYARVSYFRELHGDLNGARSALIRALSAGGEAAENVAYVDTLLSHVDLLRGRLHLAAREAREALARFLGYPAAGAALARVQIARGDLRGAIARMQRVVQRLPLPEHVILLGETQQAVGQVRAARRTLALVGAEQRLLASAGVNTDVELAIFEADHGSPRRALRLARAAWSAAPSVRSADALGWALTRSGHRAEGLRWAHRALALGSKDPVFLAHAALAGDRAARGAALRSPALSPLLRRELER
jgi:tetratricopeptide (TPR) repeat protein